MKRAHHRLQRDVHDFVRVLARLHAAHAVRAIAPVSLLHLGVVQELGARRLVLLPERHLRQEEHPLGEIAWTMSVDLGCGLSGSSKAYRRVKERGVAVRGRLGHRVRKVQLQTTLTLPAFVSTTFHPIRQQRPTTTYPLAKVVAVHGRFRGRDAQALRQNADDVRQARAVPQQLQTQERR